MIRRVVFAMALLALFSLRATGPSGARVVARYGFDSGGVSTALPGAPLSFDVSTRVAKNLSVDIFPIDAATFAALATARAGDPVDFASPAVRHASATVSDWHKEYYTTTHVTLPGLPIGLYAVRINAADFVAVRRLDIGTVGIVTAQGVSDRVSFAVDLNTYHKRSDVIFEPLGGSGATAHADASGIATFANDSSTGVEASGSDGSIAFATFGYVPIYSRRLFLQTDRPLYRPADSMNYRIVAREGAPGHYILPNGDVSVEIRDPSYKVVATQRQTFDAYGTVSGTVDLSSDAELGNYNVYVDGRSTGSFTVQAYVKPEYVVEVVPQATYVIAGSVATFSIRSKYFFGKPAAGIHFIYRAKTAPPPYRWFSRYLRFAGLDYGSTPDSPDVSGEATADARGRAQISIPTAALESDEDRELSLDVDARDASGKTVTARGVIPVTRSDIRTNIAFDRWFAVRSDTVTITVTTVTIGGSPKAGVPVAVTFDAYDRKDANNTPAPQTLRAVSDAMGLAHLTWAPDRDGYVRVRATARDDRGRATSSESYLWVSSDNYRYAYAFSTASIAAQKTTYAPDEKAELLVTSPRGDVDALVNVTGAAGKDRTFVAHLATVASTVSIDVPQDVANAVVTIWIPTPRAVESAQTTLAVTPAIHALSIHIRPAKNVYRPGDLARFSIDVRDERGAPARAQVGLGVVDDSVLALAEPNGTTLFDRLYATDLQNRYADADWSLGDIPIYAFEKPLMAIARVTTRNPSGAVQPRQTQDTYSVSGQQIERQPSLTDVRSDFRDTAYWSAAVTTDERGRATVSFRWPDNLTTYTASGLAVTQDSSVGAGDGHALVTKPYLVRLATPRFMRTNDTARLVANASGSKNARDTLLRFSAPELGIDDRTARVKFDRYAAATSDFNVSSRVLGTSLIRLAGVSGGFSDGLRRSIPLESDRVEAHVRFAGSLPHDASLALGLPADTLSGALRIDLSPSVLSQLFASVRLLDVYPYACVEQTMSSALPLIAVERLAKQSGLEPPANPDPNAIAAHAIARLAKLQHGDGSWGWWENDAANPFMTGYAIYGLAELRRDGHAVPSDMIDRGVASLRAQLLGDADTAGIGGNITKDSIWNTRAFMLFALSDAAPAEVDRMALAATDARAARLNPYALSVLGLAHLNIGDRPSAIPLFERLKALAIDTRSFTHWSGGGWHYGWEDDPIETTAYALRFYHAMEPSAERVSRAVSWLRVESRGSWWYTTKDTAAAIYALTEAIDPSRSEFAPNETIDVYANDRLVKTVKLASFVPDSGASTIELQNADVPSGGSLRFVRHGIGSLYWSVDWTTYVRDGALSTSDISPSDATTLQADTTNDFAIKRTYSSPARGDWAIGDQIDVTLEVTAKVDAEFVAIEDPLPAGLEYQPRLHEAGDDWSGLQFLDDRVAFFASKIWAGRPVRLTYRLRASTVGTFTAPPPTAYAMYGPPVSAIGRAERVRISP